MLYEVMCIAMAIYWEARGEPFEGQVAVAQVIMNRVHDPRYPSDACSVVYDTRGTLDAPWRHQCQFSFFCDGKSDEPKDFARWWISQAVADAVYHGRAGAPGDATHYHKITVTPYWADPKAVVAKVSRHVFYQL